MDNSLELTFLGTGTSQGVPVIGCNCYVCTSEDARDQRLRTAAMLSYRGKHIVIDAGPDFRQQMLRARPTFVDAILLTHEHNDHVNGLDDVRAYNFMRMQDMPIYCSARVAGELRTRFAYAFSERPYPGAPRFDLQLIDKDTPFRVAGLDVQPIEIMHGHLPILGFRVGDLAYLTDVKTIASAELRKLENLDTLVISALHHTEHHSHLTLEESLEWAARIAARRTYLLHFSHRMGRHDEVEDRLPPGVFAAYDGLTVAISTPPATLVAKKQKRP